MPESMILGMCCALPMLKTALLLHTGGTGPKYPALGAASGRHPVLNVGFVAQLGFRTGKEAL